MIVSGKSFLFKCLVKSIRSLFNSNKSVQVLCPTGNSADLVSGVTLHSFFFKVVVFVFQWWYFLETMFSFHQFQMLLCTIQSLLSSFNARYLVRQKFYTAVALKNVICQGEHEKESSFMSQGIQSKSLSSSTVKKWHTVQNCQKECCYQDFFVFPTHDEGMESQQIQIIRFK